MAFVIGKASEKASRVSMNQTVSTLSLLSVFALKWVRFLLSSRPSRRLTLREFTKNFIAMAFVILAFQASADLSQSEMRSKFVNLAKRDFIAHVNASGLRPLVKPLNPLEAKFKQEIEAHSDAKLSRLETKLLFRYPQFIPAVKRVREFAYATSDRLCQEESGEGNETDSARHFIGSYALTLLTGANFSYKYLTAHEGWLIDEDLNQFTGYNFASSVMDLRNNAVGIEAAKRDHEQIKIFSVPIAPKIYSWNEVKTMAIQALKRARKENQLVAVYSKDGACSQPSQRDNFRRRVGLGEDDSIY